jgi:hypothetical protein
MPVDQTDGSVENQLFETGFLTGFSMGCFRRRLTVFKVALGKPPVAVGIADQQKPRRFPGDPAEDDTTGANLSLCTSLVH